MDYGIAGESGREQDPDVGANGFRSVTDLASIHAGQHDIGQKQVDSTVALLNDRNCSPAFGGHTHIVRQLAQKNSRFATSTITRVISISARDGAGSPPGWLCRRMTQMDGICCAAAATSESGHIRKSSDRAIVFRFFPVTGHDGGQLEALRASIECTDAQKELDV